MTITLWYKWDGGWIYNHYSEGYDLNAEPIPKSSTQIKAWAKQRWAKEKAKMVDNKVVYFSADRIET